MNSDRVIPPRMSREIHWYEDGDLVASLPFWLRAYALYSRRVGDRDTRHVRGGSFLLRTLQRTIGQLSAIATVRARPDAVICVDVRDARLLEIFYEARAQNAEQFALESLLRQGDSFIDVGANYGTFSLVARRIVGASGKVIAVEPQPRLAQLIRRSAQLNGFSNVEVREFAAGSAAGPRDLFVPRGDSGRAGLHPAFSGRSEHTVVRVGACRLDAAINWRDLPGNLVIKIDVEGSERDVIDGATDLLTERKPAMMIELNPWSALAAGYSVAELLDSISAMGYESVTPVDSFVGIPDVVSTERQQNVVATALSPTFARTVY